jgi:hypothetical protein
MHLKCTKDYTNRFFSITAGETTEKREDISAEMKTYLFNTFPGQFELIASVEPLRTPEDGLKLMTKVEPEVLKKAAPVVKKVDPKVAAKSSKSQPKAKGK